MATTARSQPRSQPQSAPPAAPPAQPDQPPAPTADSQSERKPPVFSWSHATGSGRVEIAVWDKTVHGDNGDRVLYHVTCQRSYRRQEGGFENTAVFWPTDLLVLAHGLAVVFDRIKELQQPAVKESQEDIPY